MSCSKRIRKRKCRHCNRMYIPDPRTADRQKHCSSPECKRASKAWRQSRWLKKKENKDYFSGAENVHRVQRWRSDNPEYWKRGTKAKNALQDDCLLQPAVVVGLIASLTGPTLQDDKIYCINEGGVVSVLKAGETPEKLSTISMGESKCRSSISIADKCLYIRTQINLYCISN